MSPVSIQFCCNQALARYLSVQVTSTPLSYVSVDSNWVHPPRATPGKIFLSERIPATRAKFFV